jgi:predicted transposase YbfD/YdcC
MSDTTPAQAATPEPQAGDGQQMEPEQTNSEHAQALSPEQLRAELEAARKEAASYRTKLRQTEKAKTDAETAAMAEQGKYKELYEAVRAKADERDALQERLDAITAQAQAANERRIAAIPDHMRSLVPEYDDALKLAAWLDANAAVFSRPTPPPLDGRAGGNGTPATVTDAEVLDFATRMRIDPAHVDRAKLAKLKR